MLLSLCNSAFSSFSELSDLLDELLESVVKLLLLSESESLLIRPEVIALAINRYIELFPTLFN